MIKLLNKLLHKYMWVFERDNGDKGFVIARNRKEAITKLTEKYPDTRERVAKTDADTLGWMGYGWMYLYHAENARIDGDIFVVVEW